MRLLGPPQVEVDGVTMRVDTRKAVAVLAYLAVEGGRHPRDRLVDLLWPDADVDLARSSLRRTLSTIRSALGGRWLITDRQVASLDLETVEVDVCTAEKLLDRHDHADESPCTSCAVELAPLVDQIGSQFLDGFAIRGAAPFERWMLDTADRIRMRLDRAAEIVERARVDAGDLHSALEVVRRRVADDPLREDAARAQMRYEAWSGDRSAAIDTYRRLVAHLDEELGVPPLEETTDLYHVILADDLPSPSSPDRRGPRRTLDQPTAFPLAGRDVELEEMERSLLSGEVVFVEGTAGMGKTRVLEELTARLRHGGRRVLAAAGNPGEAEIPFGLLHQALAPTIDQLDFTPFPDRVLAELGQLFPAVPSTTARSAGTKTALYDALAYTLIELGRCVLVIDDIQWADPATVEALSFLVRHHTEPIRLVVSAAADVPRSAASVDDVKQRATPVTLTPLDADAVAQLAAHAGRTIALDHLLEQTRGVPLLVVETLRSPDGSPPESVRRLFESRIDILSGSASQVLEVLVVVGAPTPSPILQSASGRSRDETDAALHELIAAGLVTETDDAVELAFGPVAQLVQQTMTPPRARLINRRCADALATIGADSIRIARHHLDAGDHADAAVWFERAGDVADGIHAHGSALSAFESALAAGHEDRGGIHAKIARTAMRSGDYRRAVDHYESALAAAARPEIVFELGVLHRRLRRWDLAAGYLRRIDVDRVGIDLAARTCAELAIIEHRRGLHEAARHLAERALERARQLDDPDLLATAENAAALVDLPPGRETHLRSAAQRATDPSVRMAALNNLAATLTDLEEAVATATEAADLADATGDRHLAAAVHSTLADALRAAGQDHAARAEVTRSVELFAGVSTDTDDLDPHIWMLSEF